VNLSLEEAEAAMQATPEGALPEAAISSYSTDTRTLLKGALFFALKGENHDAHDHVAEAFARGAAAAVVSRAVEAAGPKLRVYDTLDALQDLARHARTVWGQDPKRKLTAITGSAGKTTAKEAIAKVLSGALKVGKTEGNFNNHIGVPLSILHLPDDAEAAVIEIGMNHAGEIRHLAEIALPRIAVVTNAGTAHIENFDSPDGVALAKRELVEALPSTGVAVLNSDDVKVRGFAKVHAGRSIFYGTGREAEVRAERIEYDEAGVKFEAAGIGAVRSPIPGPAGVMASLAALATAQAYGLDAAMLKDLLATVEPPKMRTQRLRHRGMTVWNDCYNSNPEAAKMMLDLLAATPARRRIAVLGEMRELGRWSEELHREVGQYAARCGISVLVGIRGAAQQLVDGAKELSMSGAAFFFDKPETAGAWLRSEAREGDALLFKGSRGTRVELALEEFLREG
jgi:UDP-N-acetylmuramoyl-tripeptide--D-alanyl-D-alanine ligase